MKETFVTLLSIAVLALVVTPPAGACTSFIIKTKDGSPIYGRTCEWGAFDARSNLVVVPGNLASTSKLGGGKPGMTWKNKYGYVAINALNLPFYLDGMNETGLTIGALYLPGFAEFQSFKAGEESSTVNNMDLIGYVLGQFKAVEEIKTVLPKLRVVVISKEDLSVPMPLHYVVTDSAGNSIVIEYVKGKLNIYDNEIGVMTNSPTYDWHIVNLRNYTQLTPYAQGPGDKETNGINFTPFGSGAGMAGLPGDYSSPSRFIRAFEYVQTSLPLEGVDAAINQASRILNNFDYPKGFERTGTPDKYSLGYTQWSTIGDIKNKRYYWWTEWNRQMRMVDLSKLNFDGGEVIASPLDKVRAENIDDRTKDFLK
ncbi:MAG: choloylglycine hydrolase family protein [Candidatus Aureabacteria bacterium]|nr:choloylglycine hydrolase family protein [Candidatus Auribacterota bacterium]